MKYIITLIVISIFAGCAHTERTNLQYEYQFRSAVDKYSEPEEGTNFAYSKTSWQENATSIANEMSKDGWELFDFEKVENYKEAIKLEKNSRKMNTDSERITLVFRRPTGSNQSD